MDDVGELKTLFQQLDNENQRLILEVVSGLMDVQGMTKKEAQSHLSQSGREEIL